MRDLHWYRLPFVIPVVLITMIAALSTPMWATLGDNAASVLSDQARMKGTVKSVDRQAYVVHEISTTAGDKVREYVSAGGAVFAVAWEGQLPPDLQQLLGPYFQQAKQAQQAAVAQARENAAQGIPRRRRAPLVIQTPGLVLYQGGHVRNFHGLAYIPQLMPQGVPASAIR